MPGAAMRDFTGDRRQLFAHEVDLVRFGGVAAQHRQVDFGAGLAAQQPLAFIDVVSRVDWPSMARM